MNPMNHSRSRSMSAWLVAASVAIICGFGGRTEAQQQPFDFPIYAKVDHQNHSAKMFYFHPQNGWSQFAHPDPNEATDTESFADMLGSDVDNDDYVYFLGVKSTTIIEGDVDLGDPDWNTRIDHFNDPEYTEMNHHMVVRAIADYSNRPPRDPCNHIWPIAAGSEFTSYEFPKDGLGEYTHAMEFRGGDSLGGAAWHWSDTGANPTYDVYVEFELLLDVSDQQLNYTDVNVSWISANLCDYSFCLSDGEPTKSGSYTAPVDGQIILAMPHLHDHAEEMTLKINGQQTVATATPTNSSNYETVHHCHGGDPSTSHTHAGHLAAGGLQDDVYAPGSLGPSFFANDTLEVEAEFDIPAHAGSDPSGPPEVPIDNVAIWMVFWEAQ